MPTSADDFEIGEIVRMKNAEDQPDLSDNYVDLFGHICVVLDRIHFESVTDCLTLRSIATGEQFSCWTTRVEKYEDTNHG